MSAIRSVLERLRGNIVRPSSKIDRNSRLAGKNYIGSNCTLYNTTLNIYSYTNDSCFLANTYIGKYTCIGPQVLSGLGQHPTTRTSTHRMFYSDHFKFWREFPIDSPFEECKPVSIGNDVWIGARTILRDGITVGDGAIIGANSVVTENVEPYTINVGSPCRQLRLRFPEELCQYHLQTRWWDLDPSSIKELARIGFFSLDYTTYENVADIISSLKSRRLSLEKGSL